MADFGAIQPRQFILDSSPLIRINIDFDELE